MLVSMHIIDSSSTTCSIYYHAKKYLCTILRFIFEVLKIIFTAAVPFALYFFFCMFNNIYVAQHALETAVAVSHMYLHWHMQDTWWIHIWHCLACIQPRSNLKMVRFRLDSINFSYYIWFRVQNLYDCIHMIGYNEPWHYIRP